MEVNSKIQSSFKTLTKMADEIFFVCAYGI